MCVCERKSELTADHHLMISQTLSFSQTCVKLTVKLQNGFCAKCGDGCEIKNSNVTESDLGVVGGLLNDLRSHPERRTHKGFPFDLCVSELASYTKVSQFDLTVF